MAKRRKKKTHPNYKARRTVLVLLLLALVAGGGWYAGKSGLFTSSDEPEQSSLSDDEQASQIGGSLPSVDQGEASSQVDPEPEPEIEPDTDSTPAAVLSNALGNWNLLLVNPDNPLPSDFTVDLEVVYQVDNMEYRVDSRIVDQALDMFNTAKLDGIDIYPTSAYRSVEYQQGLYERKIEEFKELGYDEDAAVEATLLLIAYPATSEHHTGLAMDIISPDFPWLEVEFADTPAFRWLDAHAHEYGFILRYGADKTDITSISYEPWHYRYVGVEHATVMKENNWCLEEYISALRSGALDPKPVAEESGDEDGDAETDGGETRP